MLLKQSLASAHCRIGCLPFAVALLLITLPATAVGNRTAESAMIGKDVPVTIVAAETYSGLDRPTSRLIRSEAEFKSVWKRIHRGRKPLPPLPVVDFEHDMLILVAMGSRNSGGFGIDVARVIRDDASLHILVRTRCPAPDAIVTMALVQPMQLVKVAAGDQKPNFIDQPDPSCARFNTAGGHR